MAGFNLSEIRMLAEPNAALLDYVYRETDRGFLDLTTTKRFITIDLGGGTCDVVVIDVKQDILESGKRNLIFRPVGTPNRGDLGGSDFDKAVARAFLAYFLGENNIEIDIEADGGINLKTADAVKKAGANILVSGTAILIAKDYKVIIDELRK